MKKIFFFDCDQTLWENGNGDYISSINSDFELIGTNILLRSRDKSFFTLKAEVRELFSYLKDNRIKIGIISDNKKKSVIKSLKLFGLMRFISGKAINVRLWRGYCPKHVMISEVLNKPVFQEVSKSDVIWVDDKNYSREAKEIGVKFIQVNKGTDLLELIKNLI